MAIFFFFFLAPLEQLSFLRQIEFQELPYLLLVSYEGFGPVAIGCNTFVS